jgi:hypothetical protein
MAHWLGGYFNHGQRVMPGGLRLCYRGDAWRGQVVLGECDNLSVVCAVNSGTVRENRIATF